MGTARHTYSPRARTFAIADRCSASEPSGHKATRSASQARLSLPAGCLRSTVIVELPNRIRAFREAAIVVSLRLPCELGSRQLIDVHAIDLRKEPQAALSIERLALREQSARLNASTRA